MARKRFFAKTNDIPVVASTIPSTILSTIPIPSHLIPSHPIPSEKIRSRRGSLNSGFGYSAISDIGEKELEAHDNEGSDGDDDPDEDDDHQPVRR